MEVLKATLHKLFGSPDEFTLETRIFNAICLVTILVVIYNIAFSFVFGLYETGWIFLVLFLFGLYIYYLSRYRNQFVTALTIAGILLTVMFSVNYFFNEGMVGSSLLSFSILLFLLLITGPARHSLYWIAFNLVTVLGLLTLEYLYPEFITEKYPDRLTHVIDLASTYLIDVFFYYFGTLFFTRAYKVEQKRVEQRSVVLERLNEEKNKLFSIVSHDLRSPLASVQQYLEILKEIDLDAEQRRKIESELLTGINYTQEMLFNLLSWSTSQMSGTKVSLVPVSVFDCLKPIAAIYKPLALKKGIDLDFRVEMTQNVLADVAMLQLIVRNLIGNAIKFTNPGGLITIDARQAGKTVLISVKDTGRGIRKEDKDHVFSLQAKPTYGTNQEKGVGLGLFLCKEYAEAQNGTIRFESVEDKGTIFFLEMPLPV